MYSRKHALRQARRYRTCPAPSMRRDPSHQHLIKKHLRICPFCSTPDMSDDAPWEQLSEQLARHFSNAGVSMAPSPPEPGQLRSIKSEYGGWQDGFYYHPPLVLILDSPDANTDSVQVAQTYFDISLAAPGDLILSSELTALGELFIQCRNVYHVYTWQLDNLIDQLAPAIIESVFALKRNPNARPADALAPRPLTPSDIRRDFHDLEKETARFFACSLATAAQPHLELIKRTYTDVATLQKAIRRSSPGIFWPFKTATIEETLTLVQFPDEQLQWAAKDNDKPQKVAAQWVQIKKSVIETLAALTANIYINRPVQAQWVVSGQINKLPDDLNGSLLLIRIVESETPDKVIHTPDRQDWDETTGYFHASFNTLNKEPLRVALAVIIGG